MKRILMLLACCLWLFGAAGFALADAESGADLRGASFRVAVLQDFPPLYGQDSQGRPTGFAIDLLETMASAAGFTIDYVVTENWGTAAQLVRDGVVDFVPGFGINEERLAEFSFSVPMETFPVRIFIKKDDRRIRTVEDLAATGFTTAVIIEGSAHVELRCRGGFDLVPKTSVDEGLNALLAGIVDAFVFPEAVLLQKMRSMGLEGLVEAVDEPLLTAKRGYLFRLGDERVESFNQVLTALVDSPLYGELFKKWYGEPTPFWTIKRVVTYMGVLVAVLAAVLVVWRSYSVGRFNKRLKRSEKHLAARNRELEQLVYVASHDLRSPLVNVDGFSRELEFTLKDIGALLEKKDTDQQQLENLLRAEFPEMQQSLERIRKSTRQMDLLIKGLLKLSRSVRGALQLQPIDMNRLVQDLFGSFAFQIEDLGIELTIGDLPPCRGDISQVTQVFANLIDNAIKYRDQRRQPRIHISGEVKKESVLYRVADNGIGIAANHQSNIFELFHRLNPVDGEGEGLGLTAVKQILSRLDGDIQVESQPGNGSVFIVALPAVNMRQVKG
jgi:signal transduction histidine kinase